MSENRLSTSWPMLLIVAAIAAAIGFGLARGFPRASTPPKPAAAEPAEAKPANGEVRIPDAYLTAANIGVEPVAAGTVHGHLLVPAVVAALPGGEAVIVARASGTLSRVGKMLGDSVRAGETIARVDSLEAATMSADRRVARTKVEQARTVYEREAGLFSQGVSPRQEMEAAKATLDVAEAESQRASAVARGANLSDDGRGISVVSPIAGRITNANATLGSFVAPEAELFRVAAPGAVRIEAALTVQDAGRVAPGDDATILMRTGETVEATVRSVTPTVDAASRTITAVLMPQHASPLLVVGDGVQVRLHSRAATQEGITVPEDAVQNIAGKDVLFIRTADGFVARPVLVGERSGGSAQIISGVKPGERVATRNAFLVKAESQKASGEEE